MNRTQRDTMQTDYQVKPVKETTFEPTGGPVVAAASFIIIDQGGFDRRLDWGFIDSDTFVVASITEVDANDVPFQGAASMTLDNIVPRNRNVSVRGSIGWDHNLRAQVTLVAVK